MNNSGQRLIDICKTHNMFILNGSFGQDRAMTFRKTSVIDYSIVSSNTFDILSDFRIIEVDRLFSDGHSLLRVDLRTRCNPPTVEHPYTRNKPQSNFIRPSELERFMINFDQNKANDILSVLESCDTESCEATINLVAHQISNAFKSAASKTQSGKKKISFGKKETFYSQNTIK